MKKYFRRAISYFAINVGILSAFGSIPTVYDRENTADTYPHLKFKEFEELPEIPTLPDPFTFADGSRSTDFSDWERHRSEILQMLWHYDDLTLIFRMRKMNFVISKNYCNFAVNNSEHHDTT